MRVRRTDGGEFIVVLPDLGGTPHVMTWPNPRKMFVRLAATTWLVDIDRPALEEIDVPLGLYKIRPFAVSKFSVYIMFGGDRVVGFSEEGVRFDFEYGCNVTNVELQNDTLVVTWWPSGQGKWTDRIDIATGKLLSSTPAS